MNSNFKALVNMKRYFFYLILLITSLFIIPAYASDNKKFRILHVMSYHSEWKWNIEQLNGFKDALADLKIEYKVVELDTKRNSDDASIKKKAELAHKIISEWNPDLLYSNDDNAQIFVSQSYINSSMPIVFSGVNRDPSEYNFIGSSNVTGVLEQEHFVSTVKLMNSIIPEIKKLAVIVDSGPTWKGVMSRMRTNLKHLPGMESVEWKMIKTFSEFKETMNSLQGKVDAVAMLGVFNLKDTQGHDVDYEEIQKWVTKYSQIPDFSFWETRVDRGTLCAVAVSGYEQGFLAGKKAKQILVDETSPETIPMEPSMKGQPMINLKRAKSLGLSVDVNLLLNSAVKVDYIWNK